MVSGILKPFLLYSLKNIYKQMVLLFCRVWIRLILTITFALEMRQIKTFDLNSCTHQNSVRVQWIGLISLTKVNTHLLTCNHGSRVTFGRTAYFIYVTHSTCLVDR